MQSGQPPVAPVSNDQTPAVVSSVSQPTPFIPMVPPLANTFSSSNPFNAPTVTSALVDNLINNNPFEATTVTSVINNQQPLPQTNVQQEPNSVDNLASNVASQLFVSPNLPPSQALINSEQTIMSPPSALPATFSLPTQAPVQNQQQQQQQQEGSLSDFNIKLIN